MNKKPLVIAAVVLLLCAVVAAWLVLKSGHEKAPNMPPTAALRLDSIDETNRVVSLSDGGSSDSDGTLQSWRIAWGDGKEENLSAIPQKARHTYASEGEYKISLWCVDNLGATSSPPAMTNITLDFLKRQKALEQPRPKRRNARPSGLRRRQPGRKPNASNRSVRNSPPRKPRRPRSNKSWKRSARLRRPSSLERKHRKLRKLP